MAAAPDLATNAYRDGRWPGQRGGGCRRRRRADPAGKGRFTAKSRAIASDAVDAADQRPAGGRHRCWILLTAPGRRARSLAGELSRGLIELPAESLRTHSDGSISLGTPQASDARGPVLLRPP